LNQRLGERKLLYFSCANHKLGQKTSLQKSAQLLLPCT
jgi:hypothetical protein